MDQRERNNNFEQSCLCVIIIGAGPVGVLAALTLASLGHKVKIFEKRRAKDQLNGAECKGRSINLTTSPRGLSALQEVGLEHLVTGQSAAVDGRVVHNKDGSTKMTYYGQKKEKLYSISRNGINQTLIKEAKLNDNITFFYEHKFQRFNEQGDAIFKCNGKSVQSPGDLIIGADGANSKVRLHFFRDKKLDYFEHSIDKHGYLEIQIQSGEHHLDKSKIHVWPRGQLTLVLLPNIDETFTGTLFMPICDFEANFRDLWQLKDFFKDNFPDLMPKENQEAFWQKLLLPAGKFPSQLVSNKSRPYNFMDKIVLVGDAAHSVLPFYGQGMNAGFEDIKILVDKLKLYDFQKENIGVALREYSKRRWKDGHAINDLAREHSNKLCSGVASMAYSWRHWLDIRLHQILGDRWIPEYTMVALSNRPYSECVSSIQRQDNIIKYFIVPALMLIIIMIIYTIICTVNDILQ